MSKEYRPKVALVYKSLPQYRRRFYELLRERLHTLGVDFVLIYGQPGPSEAAKRDSVDLPWAHKIRNRIFKLGSREVYWQPCLGLLKDVDLVIVEQASKLLVNYVLLAYHLLGIKKLAFWGHGKNFQAHGAHRISEFVKRLVSRKVYWWFAYNNLSAEVVRNTGFPEHRITVVQNAIDTRQLAETRQEIGDELLESIRKELGIKGKKVCIYAGGMYAEKRLRFLLEACALVRQEIPDFEMVFIGAGTDKDLIEEAARRHRWIHYVGPKFEEEKVPYFMLSKLFLMPGLVGLAVLDTFALEVPLVTTAISFHSPEIEYLKDGFNGVVIEDSDDPAAYAAAVTQLLKDDTLRERLVAGCRKSATLYTVEEMAERFAGGVLRALESDAAYKTRTHAAS